MRKNIISAMLALGMVIATGCTPAANNTTTAKVEEKVTTEDKKLTTQEMKSDSSKTDDTVSNVEKAGNSMDKTSSSDSEKKENSGEKVGEVKDNGDGSKTVDVTFTGLKGNPAKIEVTAKEDKILAVKILEHKEDADVLKTAEAYIKHVVDKNTLKSEALGINIIEMTIEGAISDGIEAMGFDPMKFE